MAFWTWPLLSETALLLILLYGIFRLVGYFVQQKSYLPLPPGPKGSLITGNLHQLPKVNAWKTYMQWSRHFGESLSYNFSNWCLSLRPFLGPLIHLRIFTRHFIILNSPQAITDLLEKRSVIYSDRPQPYMHIEILGRKNILFNISSENERFSKYRRLLREELGARACRKHAELMQEETRIFLKCLKDTPERFLKLIRM